VTPAAEAAPVEQASTDAAAAAAALAAETTTAESNTAEESVLVETPVAPFDDGGFVRAVTRLVHSGVAVGVYVYALWVIGIVTVWLGGLNSLKGLTVSFGGASVSTQVQLFETLQEDVHSKTVSGQLVLPSFSFTLFPTTINDATTGWLKCFRIPLMVYFPSLSVLLAAFWHYVFLSS
jgi:hypothetical protein